MSGHWYKVVLYHGYLVDNAIVPLPLCVLECHHHVEDEPSHRDTHDGKVVPEGAGATCLPDERETVDSLQGEYVLEHDGEK